MSRIGSKVTQSQVALRAGVSLATVSRALSGHPLVTPETRQRTLKAVREMGYKPDMNARALATRKSFLIAILCRETYRQSALDVIQGIQDILLPSDYSLLVYAHGDKASDEATHLQSALDRRAEGLIVYPALDLDGLSNADRFKSLQNRVPVVQMLPTLPDLPSIRRNDELAARLATRHLIELGHRRIVHLTHAYYRDPDRRRFYYDVYARWRGYEQEMLASGLRPVVITHRLVVGGVDYAVAAQEIASAVINDPIQPTAICAYSDYQALGLIHAFAERGVRVPQDISIVGLDETSASSLCHPPLTTIRWPAKEAGRRAGRMILDLLDGKRVQDALFEPQLIRRQSAQPPPSPE